MISCSRTERKLLIIIYTYYRLTDFDDFPINDDFIVEEINIFIDFPDKYYPRSIFRVSETSMKIFLSLLLWE